MFAAVLFASALLIAALHVPLLLGKVPPNRFYGFRTPRLVADERAWYPANQVAGRNGLLLAAGIAALGAFSLDGAPSPWMMAFFVIFMVGNLAATFASASAIVAALDRQGPRLDTRSSFERDRDARKAANREALLRKIGKEK